MNDISKKPPENNEQPESMSYKDFKRHANPRLTRELSHQSTPPLDPNELFESHGLN